MKNKQRKNTYDKIMQNSQDSKKRNTKCSRSAIENNTLSFNQKAKMYFATNDFMSYEKQAKKILSALKLRSTSTGTSNKKLIFSGLALLMFCGFGHLVTGSNAHAVNLDQVIRATRNQVDIIKYSPDKIGDTNPTSKKVKPELNQLQPSAAEESTAAQAVNPLEDIDETHTVTTDTQDEQTGLSRDQILSATRAMTGTAQTAPDTTTPVSALSDVTVTVSSQNPINQLSNNKKLYCLEALNLCNPFIEKEAKIIENVRLYNGYINSIAMKGKPSARIYLQDEGIGSPNLMKILFPSTAGELNINTGRIAKTLDKCDPSPEDIANLIVCLFKYQNNDPETVARFTLLNKWDEFGKGFVRSQCPMKKGSNTPTYDYDSFFTNTIPSVFAKQYKGALIAIKEKLSKITDRESRENQLYYDLLNYEGKTAVENKKITTFFSIIQNAIYMIDHQEKNDSPEEDENIRIFPKYAAERFILSYFIDKFDKDEQIAAFYSKVTELLNNLSLSNERIVTEEELNSAKKRIEETLPILNKYKGNQFSPYKGATVQNGTCYSIQQENDKISFSAETFADCADIAVRHVINLLIYSQGINKNPTDPWASVLPEKGSDQEKDIQHKLDEVTNAIKNKGTQVALYPLKDRLQMFFLHQKEVGADNADDITRTLWEYVIYNLTEENNGFAPLRYNRKNYELYPGYKNMLTFMCRCAQELFPEKDVKMAYEKVKECLEYGYNQNLNLAIKAVFKLFNECDCDIIPFAENFIQITYHELGDMSFILYQSKSHARVSHDPTVVKRYEISSILENKNDFTRMLTNLLSGKTLCFQEDFYTLFFRGGLEYDYKSPDHLNFRLSSNKIANSKFLSRYHTLKFLKSVQGEENNPYRISGEILKYFIYSSRIRSCLNVQIDKNKVDISNFIFDRYINEIVNFKGFSYDKKALEHIDSNNQVTITSFGNNPILAHENTNTAFRYTLDENGNAILYPVEDKENLYIPNTITVGKNKIKVAGLGKFACYNFKVLSKVIIENTENEAESATDFKIGEAAFYGCENLESLDLSSNDKIKNIVIGDAAFQESSLTLFTISAKVKSVNIKSEAFADCKKLESLDFSSCVELENFFTGYCAFNNSPTKLVFPTNIRNFEFGFRLFGRYRYFGNFNMSPFVKLETLCIESSVFGGPVDSVILPPNVKSLTIKRDAFLCPSLKSITIPERVTELNLDRKSFPLDCTVRVPERFKEQLESLGELSYKIEYYKTESAS